MKDSAAQGRVQEGPAARGRVQEGPQFRAESQRTQKLRAESRTAQKLRTEYRCTLGAESCSSAYFPVQKFALAALSNQLLKLGLFQMMQKRGLDALCKYSLW